MRSLRHAAAFLTVFLFIAPVSASEILTIGVLAYRPKPQIEAHWRALIPYLETHFKEHFHDDKFKIEALDFQEMEAAIQQQRIDFIVTNPANYVLLEHRIGLTQPLAGLVTEHDGVPMHGFGGAMLVRADRKDLNVPKDLEGKRIAAVSKKSFGGYQMQAYELARHGVDVTRNTDVIEMGLPHDHLIQAVLDKRVDVAFMRSGLLEDLQKEGKIATGALKVFNRQDLLGFPLAVSTQLYPEWPIAALPHVDEDHAAQFAAALLAMPKGGVLAKTIGINGFVIPYNYESVRDVAKALRLPPYDVRPEIAWEDIWRTYDVFIVILIVCIASILALLFVLFGYTRQLLNARRQIEASAKNLELERTQLRTLINTLPDLVWLKDPSGIYLTCNPLFERLFGAKESEIVGKSDYDFVDKELADFFRENDKRAIASDKPLIDEEWLSFKDGSHTGLYETIKTPVVDETEHCLACWASPAISPSANNDRKLWRKARNDSASCSKKPKKRP